MEYLDIGKIVNTHGIRGEIKVITFTDYPERFEEITNVFLDNGKTLDLYEIETVKYIKQSVILKLRGMDTIESAEAVKNCVLKIDRKNARKLPKDSFLICDLIGLSVFQGNEELGTIKEVLQTGSNDVYVVKMADNKELLIPALKTVVKKVNIAEKKMIVELPDGLMEI